MPSKARAQTSRTPKTRAKLKPKQRRNWRPAWLKAFRETGLVTAACEAAKVGRATVYEARRDEKFATAWDEIELETTEAMEREAYRRGVEGVSEPLVSAGKHVTNVRKFSDTLLIFMLKARKPHTYRESVAVEHSGRIDGKHEIVIPDTAERRAAVVELLSGAGVANGSGR